ncbi:MAG: superoxide dismutase [Bacillota bacterium]|nr:superoxide dismutase [Bacillota bacterium]
MDHFHRYISELFNWNEQMKNYLESENVGVESELWGKLDRFTNLIENVSKPLSNSELLDLQSEAETIQEDMEDYFNRKQEIGSIWVKETVLPPGGHSVPPLPYAYNALEPYISEEIMRLHHDQHHKAYVDGLNKAEINLKKARESNDFSLIKHWSRELAFNGSGHNLHSIFWSNMIPGGGGRPKGVVLGAIESYFGSFEAFKKQFSEAAKQVEGSGWALLVWSPRSRHLEVLQTEKHMDFSQWDTIPLLVLDVWEHAYYLQYKNKRAAYVDNWWNLVNWSDVESRFEKVRPLKWLAF